METALGERTDLKFIYSTARDRRSLVSASDANTERRARSVGLFAIASHSVVSSPLDLVSSLQIFVLLDDTTFIE